MLIAGDVGTDKSARHLHVVEIPGGYAYELELDIGGVRQVRGGRQVVDQGCAGFGDGERADRQPRRAVQAVVVRGLFAISGAAGIHIEDQLRGIVHRRGNQRASVGQGAAGTARAIMDNHGIGGCAVVRPIGEADEVLVDQREPARPPEGIGRTDINDIAAGAGGGRPVGGEVIGIRRVGEEPRGRGRAGRRLHRAGRGAIGEVVHARPGAIVFVDAHPIGGIGLQTGHRHVGAGAIVDDLAVVGLVVGGREVAVHA